MDYATWPDSCQVSIPVGLRSIRYTSLHACRYSTPVRRMSNHCHNLPQFRTQLSPLILSYVIVTILPNFPGIVLCVSFWECTFSKIGRLSVHIFTARCTCNARYSYCMMFVCPSVRLSVCNVGGSGSHRLTILQTMASDTRSCEMDMGFH